MIRRLFFLAFTLSVPATAVEVQSVEDWVRVVKEQSPDLRSQSELLSISDRNVTAAFGGLLPKMDLTSSLAMDHLDRDVNEGRSSTAALGLTANLYRSHLDWYQYKIASDQRDIARLNYLKDAGGILLRAIEAYLDFSVQSVVLDIANERQRLVSDQHARSKKSYRSGTSTRLDFLRLESEKMAADFAVHRAQSELNKSLVRLRAFLSVRTDEFSFKPTVFDRGFKTTVPTLNIVAKDHFEYRIQELQKHVAELEVSKARRNYWPNVDLTTEWSRSVSDFWGNTTSVWESDWSTTLNFSFNIFDGGTLSSQLANRKSEVIIQENQAESLELSLRARLIQLKEDHERLSQQVKVALEVLGLETQVYTAISGQYRVGNIGYLDFINSLNKLLSARQELQSSAAQYMNTIYAIKYNKGELL